MKKNTLFIFVILSIFASLIGTAAAPMAAPAKAKIEKVTLVQATFMEEKGMIFKFKVVGTFTEKELKGSLLVKGKSIKLRCRYNAGADIVQCTAPGGTATNFAGKSAVVSLNGFNFWVKVPSKKECPTCG
ncbi:MAG: hypothetical protein CVU44_20685 [Chloroflexi bacterium HGW-Chloroflexi-6]|nr:MAG: hypothetical protein CVU44_20685 [Chloroflexi bacterium HGW-Chloroflexi-6]